MYIIMMIEKKTNKQKNISFNNDVIINIFWHIENADIVRRVYSGVFRQIQGHSAIFSHVQAY